MGKIDSPKGGTSHDKRPSAPPRHTTGLPSALCGSRAHTHQQQLLPGGYPEFGLESRRVPDGWRRWRLLPDREWEDMAPARGVATAHVRRRASVGQGPARRARRSRTRPPRTHTPRPPSPAVGGHAGVVLDAAARSESRRELDGRPGRAAARARREPQRAVRGPARHAAGGFCDRHVEG